MTITVKQMVAWAQYEGVEQSCPTYRMLLACKTWEDVIAYDNALEFLKFFQCKMSSLKLGIDWRAIHAVKIPGSPTLSLEEDYSKDLELTAAERIRDDSNKAANLKQSACYRDYGDRDVLLWREYSREFEDEIRRAERAFEDSSYDIHEKYKKKLKDKRISLCSVLSFIPEFMKNATITHDVFGEIIIDPEECDPYDVYLDAQFSEDDEDE